VKKHKGMTRKSIKLKQRERKFLIDLTKAGKHDSREFERAYILLALDKGKKHNEIEDFYNVSRITIWRVKNKYLELGVEEAIKDEPRSGQPIKYDDKNMGEVIATACSKAPEGRARWTLRLLEEKLKENKGLETINRESIRLILKKTNVSLG
jgi:putative transposase